MLSRQEIEKRLLSRLKLTHKQYRQSCYQEKVVAIRADLGPAHPDGHHGVSTAIPSQNEAWRSYRQVLREWLDFVLEGKIPEWVHRDPER